MNLRRAAASATTPRGYGGVGTCDDEERGVVTATPPTIVPCEGRPAEVGERGGADEAGDHNGAQEHLVGQQP